MKSPARQRSGTFLFRYERKIRIWGIKGKELSLWFKTKEADQ